MATKTSSTKPDGAMGASPYAETAASLGNAMVDSMVQASQAYMDGMLAASRESAEFANRRLDADVKTCGRFSNCHSYEDMAQVQQEWVQTALQDYSRQWLRMAQVFADRLNAKGTAVGKAKARTTSAAQKAQESASQAATE